MRKWRLKERVLPLLGSRTRMTPHEHPVCAAERNMNQCQHPKSVNQRSFPLLLVFRSQIWSKRWPFMRNLALRPPIVTGVRHCRTRWDQSALQCVRRSLGLLDRREHYWGVVSAVDFATLAPGWWLPDGAQPRLSEWREVASMSDGATLDRNTPLTETAPMISEWQAGVGIRESSSTCLHLPPGLSTSAVSRSGSPGPVPHSSSSSSPPG
jgi:hypothetical protein